MKSPLPLKNIPLEERSVGIVRQRNTPPPFQVTVVLRPGPCVDDISVKPDPIQLVIVTTAPLLKKFVESQEESPDFIIIDEPLNG